VESGEWRYGQAERDRPWTGNATPESGEPEPAPNLWVDDPSNAWGSTAPWVPHQRTAEPDTGQHESVVLEPDAWYRPPTEWGRPRHSAQPAPTRPDGPLHASPVSAPPLPASSSLPVTSAGVPGAWEASPDVPGAHARTSVDTWPQPEPRSRRHATYADEFDSHAARHDEFGEQPAYGPVLGFTAGWYGLPAAFYLVWLITLDGDRQGFVGRQLGASLPWLVASVVLSLAVAGLLRWAVVGWRALTLSFAAAVIGAGVTTIAHSLTL